MTRLVTLVGVLGGLTAACGGAERKGAEEPEAPAEDRSRVRSISEQQEDGEEEDAHDGVEIEGLLGRLEASQINPVIAAASDGVPTASASTAATSSAPSAPAVSRITLRGFRARSASLTVPSRGAPTHVDPGYSLLTARSRRCSRSVVNAVVPVHPDPRHRGGSGG